MMQMDGASKAFGSYNRGWSFTSRYFQLPSNLLILVSRALERSSFLYVHFKIKANPSTSPSPITRYIEARCAGSITHHSPTGRTAPCPYQRRGRNASIISTISNILACNHPPGRRGRLHEWLQGGPGGESQAAEAFM